MDHKRAGNLIDVMWDDSIVPRLCEYIRIPNKSPLFDPCWAENGHMDAAISLMEAWCRKQPVTGMTVEVVRAEGRTPVLLIEVEGQGDDTVLLYGHLDKQPEFSGWSEGLSPWEPVIRDGKLYGRGGADDGYAVFGSLTAILALQEQGIPHARCVILIEACEESGSFDLPCYMDLLASRIGEPSLVICLDAECGNYDQLWCTTSLRGNLTGTLRVSVLNQGVHSGGASGIVPSSFRVARALLSRLEDELSGDIVLEGLHVDIPAARIAQAQSAADILLENVHKRFGWAGGTQPVAAGPAELLLNNTWRPTLCVTGAGGIPALVDAGNTLRPRTDLKLSLRLAPTTDPETAATLVKETLEDAPPHGAQVEFELEQSLGGWDSPPLAAWLETSMQRASREFFGADAMYLGTGGSIPFIGMLGARFPGVQFLVTGVLGPKSNAHGPDEFLHIETGKKLTACVARVLADHGKRANHVKAA
jgi:acetylornithine deacetylase/succinyl-diaminopimelate desuccinylase-like protein